MPDVRSPRDAYDEFPRRRDRIGAHRAESPRPRPSVVLLWSVTAAVVFVLGGGVGFLVLAHGAGAEPDPQPTAEPVTDTSYTVRILDGTGEELGESAERDLIEAGWADELVSAGESDADDFPETTVYYADGRHEAAAAGLAQELGGARIELSTAYVGDPGSTELWVVLGLDRVSAE